MASLLRLTSPATRQGTSASASGKKVSTASGRLQRPYAPHGISNYALPMRQKSRQDRRSAAARASPQASAAVGSIQDLAESLQQSGSIPSQKANVDKPGSKIITTEDIRAGQVIMEIPSQLAVTSVDVAQHKVVGSVAESRSELVGLALWLVAERAAMDTSTYSEFLKTLPASTLSPMLWSVEDRRMFLRGTSIADEVESRVATLQAEWSEIQALASELPKDTFNIESFMEAFSVVMAASCYLPSASCFALLPLLGSIERSGSGTAMVDYDSERDAAVLVAMCDLPKGSQVAIYDDRPNGELLLSTGRVERGNPCDYLALYGELVMTDGLYTAKKMVLDSFNMDSRQMFPVYKDRMPIQLLAYLRLTRIQDAAQLALVSFEQDNIISQMNEYETLQILMGDCRDILSGFQANIEDDTKELYNPNLSEKERVAIELRIEEQTIAQSTMDAVRRRLAPIRGIPTKSGMQDPNQDLLDIFETVESIPNAPKKLVDGFMSWARGDYDPEFKQKQKKQGRK